MLTILSYLALLIALQILLSIFIFLYKMKKYVASYPVEKIQQYQYQVAPLCQAVDQHHHLHQQVSDAGFELKQVFYIDIANQSYLLLYIHPESTIECCITLSQNFQDISYELIKCHGDAYLNLIVSQSPIYIFYAHRTVYQITWEKGKDFANIYQHFRAKCNATFLTQNYLTEPEIDLLENIQQQYVLDLQARLDHQLMYHDPNKNTYPITFKGLCFYAPSYIPPFNQIKMNQTEKKAKRFYALS